MAKQTGWVIAATAGATIDGRTITEQWIKDMAEQYSPDEYTALVWPEHFRSSWAPFEGKNWGTVDEVKAAKSGGKLRLFVKLTANDYLLEANKDGQKLFMSIEPNIDYKGTGKAYLTGIAVTDSPASTGTTRLKFSVGEKELEHEVSQLEELLFTDFIKQQDQQSPATEKGLLAILQDFFKSKPPVQATDTTEEEPMNKEQFDALMGEIGGIKTKVADLETKFNKAPEGDKPADKPADDKAGQQQAAVSKEEPGGVAEKFNKLNETIAALVNKVDGLETKFKKATDEVDGQEPDPTGKSDEFDVV